MNQQPGANRVVQAAERNNVQLPVSLSLSISLTQFSGVYRALTQNACHLHSALSSPS